MLKVKPVGKERHLYLSECATLTNPTKKEVKSIKSATTFINPAYERAKKYTHYTSYKIPQTLCFSSVGYYRGVPAIRFPIGLRFDVSEDKPINKIIDYRVFTKPKHRPPEFKLTLREDQEKALLQYVSINAWQERQPCGLVQLPTGKGKTILSLAIINEFKLKTLVIVHTNGLVKAWIDDIKKAFEGKVVPGLIKAKSRTVGDYITIATIQTLNNLPEDELETLFDTFGLIIQDECHHCPSTSYELVNRFRSTYRLGLTATPERNDGLTFLMTLYFGGFCYEYNKELKKDRMKDRDILPFEVIHRTMDYSFTPILRPVGQRGYKVLPFDYPVNKYGPEDIPIDSIPYRDRPKIKYNEVSDLVMFNDKNIKQVLKDVYTEGVCNNRSCVVFFTSRVHCEHYFQKFKEMVTDTIKYKSGRSKPFSEIAQLYTGATKDDEMCLKRAINREVIITFTTFGKSTEGTNIPCLEVAFLVTSINDGKNTEQAIGRIRRKCDTYQKLKRVRVYDYDFNKVYMLRSHYRTRLERYKILKGTIIDV